MGFGWFCETVGVFKNIVVFVFLGFAWLGCCVL